MSRTVNVVCASAEMPAELREHFRRELGDLPGLCLQFAQSGDEAELLELARSAEVLIAWRVPPAVLQNLPDLKLWIFPGAGVQSLIEPLRALNARQPLTLVNSHGNAYAVAQHTLALLLALLNRVVPHHNWMSAGQWRQGDAEAATTPLRGQCVGLLGYGAINRHVHRLLSGFELRFAACRRSWDTAGPAPPAPLERFTSTAIEPFLAATDILVLALPATPQTEGLLGAPQLALLGPQGVLVNVSRGSIIAEQALYDALAQGVIAGAALDVWYDYRPQPDAQGRQYPYHYPFHELPNAVLSPHRAASPFFARERWDDVLDNVQRYATSQPLRNIVDLERGVLAPAATSTTRR